MSENAFIMAFSVYSSLIDVKLCFSNTFYEFAIIMLRTLRRRIIYDHTGNR